MMISRYHLSSLSDPWSSLLFMIVSALVVATLPLMVFGQKTLEELPSLPPIPTTPPLLSGYHFRITIGEYDGYCNIQENNNTTGKLTYSGYTVDILKELAARANFTYELLTPSGYGSLCEPRLSLLLRTNNSNSSGSAYVPAKFHPDAYHERYRSSFRCGESDVNDRPLSHYSTDMYWGGYYITPERILQNQFTVPFSPPTHNTLGMMGIATHIARISDLEHNPHYKVCSYTSTSQLVALQTSFLQLDVVGIEYGEEHARLDDGTCDVIIDGIPFLKQAVLHLSKVGKCTARGGQPIGVIGEPLEYGLNHISFGIRSDIPAKVVQTLNYWLEALMGCFPEDLNGYCPHGVGSISQMYIDHGGRGDECGYVQYPPSPQQQPLLPVGAIVAIVITPLVLVVGLGMLCHIKQLKKQEQRMKKRFIQQLARNIDIGPSASLISAAKLSETFQHISSHSSGSGSGSTGRIQKEDLAKWMDDLNLDFLSDKDFDRLWETMDMDGTGYVDPLEFYSFLKECEKQFKEVHSEIEALPKTEKIKLATRRLSNIKVLGQEGVENMERRNNRRSRLQQQIPISSNHTAATQEVSQAISEASRSVSSRKLLTGCGSSPRTTNVSSYKRTHTS